MRISIVSTVMLSICVSLYVGIAHSADEQKHCPPTPLTKTQILGEPSEEGCERTELQDLEIDIRLMLEEANKIRKDHEKILNQKENVWTPDRRERARAVGAREIVTNIDQIVWDRDAAIALGKMFFWEQRVGSDGQTACASCHYKAGADVRNFSWGVGQNRIALDQQPDANGLEPSEVLEPHHILQTYENQWGGMVDFPAVLMKQANFAIIRAKLEVSNLLLDDSQKIQLELWITELQKYSQLSKELDALRAVISSSASGSSAGRYEVAQIALKLASELAAYSEGRQESPNVQAIELLDQVAQRTQKITKSAEKDLDSGQTVIQQLLAPYESKIANNSSMKRMRNVGNVDPVSQRAKLSRNTPTVINATLFDRLFHDGRASSTFNGYDHLGDESGQDGFGKWVCRNGYLQRVLIRLPHSAAASQATAPLLSSSEMSWFGRQYHRVAQKLMNRTPLASQEIHPDDSILGSYLTAPDASGNQHIKYTYRQMIQKAFRTEWHCSSTQLRVRERDAITGNQLTLPQLETNFSLFWGLAIQLYEETLISDQSPFDELMNLRRQGIPLPKNQQTQNILIGLEQFEAHACTDCHVMPELAGGTFATVYGPMLEFEGPFDAVNLGTEENEFINWLQDRASKRVPDFRVEAMPFRTHLSPRIYDAGYYNIGVSSDREGTASFDPGNGGQVRVILSNDQGTLLSVRETFGSGLPVSLLEKRPYLSFSLARRHDERLAVSMGAFKTPTLRNVSLTQPYFHNGSAENIDDVFIHYESPEFSNNQHLHPAMLGEGREGPEVDIPEDARPFVEKFFNALTDPRVENGQAPFDHPSLLIPEKRDVDPATGQTLPAHLKTLPATGG